MIPPDDDSAPWVPASLAPDACGCQQPVVILAAARGHTGWSGRPARRREGEVDSPPVRQPNRAQWTVIWTVAVLLILAWPPGEERSLGVKAVNWLVDPTDSLPTRPRQLPMGLDDDGDAVAAHDALEAEYNWRYASSGVTRLRMTLKDASDPFDPPTERQILAGIGILSALGVWRLGGGKPRIE
jgi:hypothetical protein